MHLQIVRATIFFHVFQLTGLFALDLPQCAEFGQQHSSLMDCCDDVPFRQSLPMLFETYDSGNMTKIDNTLETLNQQQSAKFFYPFSSDVPYIDTINQIKQDGYRVSMHSVITSDGYILELHRIGSDATNKTTSGRKPILLMHGLLESSHGWIALGPDHSLAYVLYDKGYDVWLGNARGTKPSQKHTKLALSGDDRKKYWSFTLHEIGVYDLPACIDFILNQTNRNQLDYIGFSQGTAVFFIMAASAPQYNAKISNMIALAPVAYLEHSRNRLLSLLNKYYGLIRKVLSFFSIYSVDADNRYLKWIAEYGCRKIEQKSPISCRFILYFLDSTQINCTNLPRIFEAVPNSASMLQIYHFAQMNMLKSFQPYDYENPKENLIHYGVTAPQPYNISHITAPVSLFYSQNDESSVVVDVMKLASQLPNMQEMYEVPSNDFKHIDFIYSCWVRTLINDRVIDVLNKAHTTPVENIDLGNIVNL